MAWQAWGWHGSKHKQRAGEESVGWGLGVEQERGPRWCWMGCSDRCLCPGLGALRAWRRVCRVEPAPCKGRVTGCR